MQHKQLFVSSYFSPEGFRRRPPCERGERVAIPADADFSVANFVLPIAKVFSISNKIHTKVFSAENAFLLNAFCVENAF